LFLFDVGSFWFESLICLVYIMLFGISMVLLLFVSLYFMLFVLSLLMMVLVFELVRLLNSGVYVGVLV